MQGASAPAKDRAASSRRWLCVKSARFCRQKRFLVIKCQSSYKMGIVVLSSMVMHLEIVCRQWCVRSVRQCPCDASVEEGRGRL